MKNKFREFKMKNKKIFRIKNHKIFMKSKIYVFILIAFLLIMPLVLARDFVVYNSSNNSQPYFWVNGTTGKIYTNNGEITAGGSGTLSGVGTVNYIPIWNGTTSLNNSNIYQDTSQNIGIGITSPFAKITIPSGTGWGGMYGIEVAADADSRRWWLHTDYIHYGDFSISTESSKQQGVSPDISRLYINKDGNVGIGTTSPNAKFHVNGSAIINGTLIGLSNATDLTGVVTLSQLQAVNNTMSWDFVPYTGSTANVALGSYNFSINTSDLFVDVSLGNVGIGTTTPKKELDVVGDIYATGDICIESGACLSTVGGEEGDITDVLGGTAITVTNSSGPQPSVAVTGNAIGDTQLAYNTGQHLTSSSSPSFADLFLSGNLTADGMKANAKTDLVFNSSTGTGNIVFIIG